MNIILNTQNIDKYHSRSQLARIITESWTETNMFCPRCGNPKICHFENNRPVADFYCENCKSEYELKSKNGFIGNKIIDGSYAEMISRITSDANPDFFFMNYSLRDETVVDFVIIPKIFFTPNIIEKRKPLSQDAKRAGWVGCNILLRDIPRQGKIDVIKNTKILSKEDVLYRMDIAQNLKIQNLDARGWLMDVLLCVNQIHTDEFRLDDVYKFEKILAIKHPNNHNILPKIRQQLQYLRDKGFIEFLGHGYYRKTLDLFK